ncbi:MAG: hydrogenase maturation nickel metallochaperone HypA [Ignavibacteria bacterium]|jgi:hydrogenase nickel incorporation protein HypA/HybF|nr:hydrogenase maturation nickel metallochaperone HypA [Ignavibacteria bacterium]MDH7528369.1 hydrogenase maturation nickel metallochaperone HypA [Ignavibacteria bacterium]
MHELSIAQEILSITKASLPSPDAKVISIKVKIGHLSGVLVDSLKFSFEAITAQTEFENVNLEVIEVPIKIRCNECSKESILPEPIFLCPECNSFNVQLLEGKELEILEIEIEDNKEEI